MKFAVLLIVLAASICRPAGAQIYVGPEIGLDASNLRMESRGAVLTNRTKPGFRGGLVLGFEFNKSFLLMTGLTYVQGGSNIFLEVGNNYYAGQYALHTLQLPLYLSYQSRPTAAGRLLLGAGPYLGYIVGGKEHIGSRSQTLSIGTNMQRDNVKPLDFGIGGYAGYRVSNGLFFRAQYQLGLAGLGTQPQVTMKSRHLSVTFGYVLQTGRKPSREHSLP